MKRLTRIKNKPRTHCIMCMKEINFGHNDIGKPHRKSNAITCCTKCSRDYARINQYLTDRIKQRLKQEIILKIDEL